jgi:hypothetical protein
MFMFTIRNRDPQLHPAHARRICAAQLRLHPALRKMAGPSGLAEMQIEPEIEAVAPIPRIVLANYTRLGAPRERCTPHEKGMLETKFQLNLNCGNKLPMLTNGKNPGPMCSMLQAWVRIQHTGMRRTCVTQVHNASQHRRYTAHLSNAGATCSCV